MLVARIWRVICCCNGSLKEYLQSSLVNTEGFHQKGSVRDAHKAMAGQDRRQLCYQSRL